MAWHGSGPLRLSDFRAPATCAASYHNPYYRTYFKNKYGHVFAVEPAREAQETIDWVHRILKDERDLVIRSRPLEATAFEVENIRIA